MADSLLRLVDSLKPEVRKDLGIQAILATHSPGCPGNVRILRMVLFAAWGKNFFKGAIVVPSFGDNAVIKLDRKVYTKFTKDGETYKAGPICTVDELNAQLAWLIHELNSDDKERELIVNKINAWISRDETGLALHVEKMRSTLDESGRPIL